MNGHSVLRLECGHERWAPFDWDGHDRLGCSTCHRTELAVVAASPSLGDDTPLTIGHGQNWYWSCGACGWVGINLSSRSAAENESARHECPSGDVHREERT